MQNVQVQITTEQLFEAIKQLPLKERHKLRDQISQLPEPKNNGNRNSHQRRSQPVQQHNTHHVGWDCLPPERH
ncbi:MAG: hypothetical protein ACRD82_02680 [Blastocatellia bacterium]